MKTQPQVLYPMPLGLNKKVTSGAVLKGSLANEPKERRKLCAGGKGAEGIVHPPRPAWLQQGPSGGENSTWESVSRGREKSHQRVEI